MLTISLLWSNTGDRSWKAWKEQITQKKQKTIHYNPLSHLFSPLPFHIPQELFPSPLWTFREFPSLLPLNNVKVLQ